MVTSFTFRCVFSEHSIQVIQNKNVWLTRKTFLYARKAASYFPRESILTQIFHLIIISKGLYNPIHIVLTQQRNWNSWFIPYELCAFDAKMTAYIKHFSINNDILQTNFTLNYKILECRFDILVGYFVKKLLQYIISF